MQHNHSRKRRTVIHLTILLAMFIQVVLPPLSGYAASPPTSAFTIQPELNRTDAAVISEPQLRVPTSVEPPEQPHIELGLAVPQEAVRSGDTFEVTILIRNTGTAVAGPHILSLWLDEELSLVEGESSGDSLTPDQQMTSDELEPGTSQQWAVTIQAAEEILTYQVVALHAIDKEQHAALRKHTVIAVVEAEPLPDPFTQTDEPATWFPRFEEPTVSLFSGAATFAYSFDAPPGRRGVQPNLGLSYSSRTSDGIMAFPHSGEGGEGWNLTGVPSIVRKDADFCAPTADLICVTNSFSLVFNGATHDLLETNPGQDPDGGQVYGVYQSKDNPSLYIERRNPEGQAFGYGSNGTGNVTKEYWIVRTENGSKYRFGFNEDAEQILYQTDGVNDVTSGHPYTGEEMSISAYRWSLDQVKDVYGNEMIVTYDEVEATGNGGCVSQSEICREVASYPQQILYNNTTGNMDNWQSEIDFEWHPVRLGMISGARPIMLTMKRLGTVNMKESGQTVWRYDLNYDSTFNGDNTSVARLKTIQKTGADNTTTLPLVEFTYVELSNGKLCDNAGNNCIWFKYPHLRVVQNGYGGVYEFDYTSLTHKGVKSWYINRIRVWDGFSQPYNDTDPDHPGVPTRQVHYQYSENEACFDDWQDNCDAGADDDSNRLVGFSTVTVTVQSGDTGPNLSHVVTDFHVIGDSQWNGKQWWQGQYTVDGTMLLREEESIWSVCPDVSPPNNLVFDFICLAKSETIQYDPTNNRSVRSWVHNHYEPNFQGDRQRGKTTRQDFVYEDADGNDVTEKIEIQHYLTNEDNWVLVPWVTGTYTRTSPSQWHPLALTLNLYDGQTDPDEQTIGIGELTMTRALLLEDIGSAPNVLYQSVDTSFGYDSHGNSTSVTTYADYGQIGHDGETWQAGSAAGSGSEPRVTASTYTNDGRVIQALSNAAAHQTTFQYNDNRFPWLSTGSTDANGLSTSYAYDTLARLIKVARPGDSLESPSTQYAYDLNTMPLRIDATVIPASIIPQRSSQYYNGLGQLVQSTDRDHHVDDQNGERDIVVVHDYDALGRQTCSSLPFDLATNSGALPASTCQSQPHTQSAYDELGRVTQMTNPDGTQIVHHYGIENGLTYDDIIDANRHRMQYRSDAFGQLKETVEILGNCRTQNLLEWRRLRLHGALCPYRL